MVRRYGQISQKCLHDNVYLSNTILSTTKMYRTWSLELGSLQFSWKTKLTCMKLSGRNCAKFYVINFKSG